MFAPCERVKVHDMLCAVARRTAIPAVLASLALTASAACSGGGADKVSAGANPTLATDPPRTNPTLATVPPPTTTTNPYAVPAVIDVAYVNRVLAGLDAVIGDVTRMVVRTKTILPDAYDRLKATYGSNDLLQLTIDSVQSDIRRGLIGYKTQPGNRASTIQQLLSATPTCIFARVQRDYSAVAESPNTVNPQWIALRPADVARDPHGYNQTLWVLTYDGFPQDRSAPKNPCVA